MWRSARVPTKNDLSKHRVAGTVRARSRPVTGAGEWGRAMKVHGRPEHVLTAGMLLTWGAASAYAAAPSNDHIMEREVVASVMRDATDAFYQFNYMDTYVPEYDDEGGEHVGPHAKWKLDEDVFTMDNPGTPTVGMFFVEAYIGTADPTYLERAIATARVLAWRQNTHGGWFRHETIEDYDQTWHPRHPLVPEGRLVLDDNVTQGALSFLIKLDEFHNAYWLRKAIDRGLQAVMDAQHECGGWPQEFPANPDRPYSAYMTFNDQVINDCIRLMLEAAEAYDDDRYLESALRGADYILESQLDSPQAGWAQQYDLNGEPAQARDWEPPCLCAPVTARNIETLIDVAVFTRDSKYLAPLPDAVRWLQSTPISRNVWARFYEFDTNRAIYIGSNGQIYYRLSDIPKRFRLSYNWKGSNGIPRSIRFAEDVMRMGLNRYANEVENGTYRSNPRSRQRWLNDRLLEHIEALGSDNLWRSNNGRIRTVAFLSRMKHFTEYLQSVDPPPSMGKDVDLAEWNRWGMTHTRN